MENYDPRLKSERFQTIVAQQSIYQQLMMDIHNIDQSIMVNEENKEDSQLQQQQIVHVIQPIQKLQFFNDLNILLEDSQELLSPTDIFIAGLLIGKSHGNLSIQEAMNILLSISKIEDQNIRKDILEELMSVPYQEIDNIKNRISMAKLKPLDDNEEQFNLIQKEIGLLDPKVNEVVGGGNDCQFKYELEQSEMARNHLAIIYDQQQHRYSERLNQQEQRFNYEEEKAQQELKDQELALRLQQEFNQEEQKVQQVQQVQPQPDNSELCCICLQPYFKDNQNADEEIVSLDGCKHIFHQNCITFYLKQKKQSEEIYIFECPFPKCGKPMQKADVEKYLNLADARRPSMAQKSYGCCPTPDCPYVFQVPNYVNNRAWNPKFECPICEATYCMKCKQDFHYGNDCNMKDINPVVVPALQKQCPQCKYWVKKVDNQGKWMHCRCTYKFCFFCGKKNCRNRKCNKFMNGDGFGDLQMMKDNYRQSLYKHK